MKKVCRACNRNFNTDKSPYADFGPSCGKRQGASVIPGREHLLSRPIADEHEYEFARESKFSNVGEDLKKSARHKYHEFKSLAEAESSGQGDGFAKKTVLLKSVDIDFVKDLSDTKSLDKFAGYLLLSKFPESPQIIPKYNSSTDDTEIKESYVIGGETHVMETTVGEARKKAREAYVELFNNIKERLLVGESAVEQINSARADVQVMINTLRQNDPYNHFANQLVKYHNNQLSTKTWRKPNSIVAIFNKVASQSPLQRKEVIEEFIGSGKKTLGRRTGTREKRAVVETLYEEVIERVGKPCPYKTYDDQAKFLTSSIGMRGIQWGQYISDKERLEHMKLLTEAFWDLSEALDLPVSTFSFGGELGVSVGARGTGKAAAHYEPSQKVINVTKNGAGTIAHEMFHAMDNLVAKAVNAPTFAKSRRGYAGQHLTNCGRNDSTASEELKEQIKAFESSLSPFIARMAKDPIIRQQSKGRFDYFVNNRQELFARVGERIVQKRLKSKEMKNTYLSGSKGTQVYPTDEELKTIEPAFDSLIAYIKRVLV